jgi:penicillin-binding protein 1B
VLRFLLLAGLAGAVVLAVVSWPYWIAAREEAATLASDHLEFKVAHKGWSFPSRVWSASAPLDLPRERLVEEARVRGYADVCPPVEPGQVCPKTGELIPRGGLFPEGRQPAGREGWTRPLALEPIYIGQLLGPDAEIRQHLPLAAAPKHLVEAIMAAEDQTYRTHYGVNFPAMARAAWINLQGGGYQQGGSTLTMQVVRNLNQKKEKTISRKGREMLLALALDHEAGKDAVLQAYLDAPYLGQSGGLSICGFAAAGRYYYGVEPADLSLSQAATLAAILPAPARYAPDRYPDIAQERRDRVLKAMSEAGWDVTAALQEPVATNVTSPLEVTRYPTYLQATRVWLEANLTPAVVYGAGLDVFTAMDPLIQEQGDSLLAQRTRYLERAVGRNGPEPLQSAGAVVDHRTGALVATYGGDVQSATDFNRATQARRQAGSSFKPLVYALAFDQSHPRSGEGAKAADGGPKYTAATAMPNAQRVFPGTDGWRPRNVGGEYSSTASLAQALSWSQNIATASLLEDAGGPQKLIDLAARLGFDTRTYPAEMGLSLGQAEVSPLEMARFIGTLLSGGMLTDGGPVLVALDPGGNPRWQRPDLQTAGTRVLSVEAAALTRDLMRLVIEFGTGGAARGGGGFPGYGGPAIGKTGTTDSEMDLWFVGGTAWTSSALWIGYDQPKRIGASASDLAAPLWGWWNHAIHVGLPYDELPGLELEHKGICTITGKRMNGTCRGVGAPFLPGTVPTSGCPISHPPAPPPDVDGDAGDGEGTTHKKYEGLWKRKAREAEEAAATAPPPPPPP